MCLFCDGVVPDNVICDVTCDKLQSIPDIKNSDIEAINILRCPQLRSIGHIIGLRRLTVAIAPLLREIAPIASLEWMHLSCCPSLQRLPHGLSPKILICIRKCPLTYIPRYLKYRTTGLHPSGNIGKIRNWAQRARLNCPRRKVLISTLQHHAWLKELIAIAAGYL